MPVSSTSSPRARPSALRRRASRPRGASSSSSRRPDRPVQSIVRGFRAYELFLEAHPGLHERVSMLALLDPSRQDIPSTRSTPPSSAPHGRSTIASATDWIPLEVRIEDNLPRAVAAYKQYDVLLVNAIFDGMNLVPRRHRSSTSGTASWCSPNTGAHEELGDWALTVNPFDVTAQAEALHEAIRMAPDERGAASRPHPGPRPRARDRRLDRGPARRPRRGPRAVAD